MLKNRKIKKNRIEIAKNFEMIAEIEDNLARYDFDIFDRTSLERDIDFLLYEIRCLATENERLMKRRNKK